MVYLAIWQDNCGGLAIIAFSTKEKRDAFQAKEMPGMYYAEDVVLDDEKGTWG